MAERPEDTRDVRAERGARTDVDDTVRGRDVRVRRGGGMDLLAAFLGFAVATFFLAVLLGIVAAIVG